MGYWFLGGRQLYSDMLNQACGFPQNYYLTVLSITLLVAVNILKGGGGGSPYNHCIQVIN